MDDLGWSNPLEVALHRARAIADSRATGGNPSINGRLHLRDLQVLIDAATRVESIERDSDAEVTSEREKFAKQAMDVIAATGIEVPVNGITALEAVGVLRGQIADLTSVSAFDAWHEDYSNVLWWRAPINEPPCFVGTPLDSDWPFEENEHHTLVWCRSMCPSSNGAAAVLGLLPVLHDAA